jgi:hypothetical protein
MCTGESEMSQGSWRYARANFDYAQANRDCLEQIGTVSPVEVGLGRMGTASPTEVGLGRVEIVSGDWPRVSRDCVGRSASGQS